MKNHINASGHLAVSGGHKIYWEDWGNPNGAPVISLHGGPGSGFHDGHKAHFDPELHHVIFHDQRGAGRSTPFATTEHNTTQDLIDDIELLRQKFGMESAHIVGGSWGSALSLLYAIAHPTRVKSLLIWSVYLVRKFEDDWVNEGYPRYNFPAEWERFISLVPEEHRTSGAKTMQYYAQQMRSTDPGTAKKFALEWTLWESALLSLNYNPAENEAEAATDPRTLAVALLETHYFMDRCFIPDNYILDNLAKIRHIPCEIVQGRFDMCTPPVGARDLAAAYGAKANLRLVNSGHIRSDPEMRAALQETAAQKLR